MSVDLTITIDLPAPLDWAHHAGWPVDVPDGEATDE